MDGWIGLSGCEKWMDVESGKWKVARFRISHMQRGKTMVLRDSGVPQRGQICQ